MRAPVADLDELPFPAYDLLPMGSYSTPFSTPGMVTSMVTSRGCPYPCTFCDAFVVHGRKYRAQSAERIVAEIRLLVREHASGRSSSRTASSRSTAAGSSASAT